LLLSNELLLRTAPRFRVIAFEEGPRHDLQTGAIAVKQSYIGERVS
jgi:hypothetical protein